MNSDSTRIYQVNSRKFDGTIRKSWTCELVTKNAEKIELVGTFKDRVEHPDLGIIEAGTVSHEKFYFKRWYNYFIFEQPAGTLRNYYINICMPPDISDLKIDYVDLDIDIIVWPNGQWQTLDLNEFHDNKFKLGYPDDVANHAMLTMADLSERISKASVSGIATLSSQL